MQVNIHITHLCEYMIFVTCDKAHNNNNNNDNNV